MEKPALSKLEKEKILQNLNDQKLKFSELHDVMMLTYIVIFLKKVFHKCFAKLLYSRTTISS